MAKKALIIKRTPSGRIRKQNVKVGGGIVKCAVCGRPIKQSSRPFGGYICGNCLATALKLSVVVSQ